MALDRLQEVQMLLLWYYTFDAVANRCDDEIDKQTPRQRLTINLL
jgi:hypothetical protein